MWEAHKVRKFASINLPLQRTLLEEEKQQWGRSQRKKQSKKVALNRHNASLNVLKTISSREVKIPETQQKIKERSDLDMQKMSQSENQRVNLSVFFLCRNAPAVNNGLFWPFKKFQSPHIDYSRHWRGGSKRKGRKRRKETSITRFILRPSQQSAWAAKSSSVAFFLQAGSITLTTSF